MTKRGSWLSFDGEHIGQGHEAARAHLEANPDITQRLIDDIHEKRGLGRKDKSEGREDPAQKATD